MRLSFFVILFGVLALVVYTIHWGFKLMHWPFAPELRLVAFALFVLGGTLYVIDLVLKRNQRQDTGEDEEDA